MYASEEADEIPDAILTAIQEGTVVSFRARAPKAAPPKVANQPKCPNGHVLAEFVAPERGYICSVCETAFGIHKNFMSCRLCDYDVCSHCFAKQSLPPWRTTPQTVEAHNVPIVLTPRSDDAAMTEAGPSASGASSSTRPITAFNVVASEQAGKAKPPAKRPAVTPPPAKAAAKAARSEGTTARPEGDEFVEVEIEPSEESDDPYAVPNPANPPKAAGDVVEAAAAVLIRTEVPPMGMDPTHRQNKGHGLSFRKNLMAPSMHLL